MCTTALLPLLCFFSLSAQTTINASFTAGSDIVFASGTTRYAYPLGSSDSLIVSIGTDAATVKNGGWSFTSSKATYSISAYLKNSVHKITAVSTVASASGAQTALALSSQTGSAVDITTTAGAGSVLNAQTITAGSSSPYTATATMPTSGIIRSLFYTRLFRYNSATSLYDFSSSTGTGYTVYGKSSSYYVTGLKITVDYAEPSISAFSIAQTGGTISDTTISVNLPYTKYTKGVSTIPVDSILATTDLSGVSTQILKGVTDISATGSTFTVGDTLTYIVSINGKSKTYKVITSAYIPAPTITATTGATQTVKGGNAISTFIYKLTNATGATVSGLDGTGLTYNVNAASDTVLIFGTPSVATYPDTIKFKISATPIAGASAVADSGYVIVVDPSKKYILYITTLSTTDRFLNNLQNNTAYSVTKRAPQASASYDFYDLIILHESLNGGDAASSSSELSTIKSVDKPLLNLKSYFYSTGRWGWGTPSSSTNSKAAVNVVMKNHPIFSGVPTAGDSIALYRTYVTKNIQPTSITIGGYNLAQTSSSSDGVAIHELPASVRVGASSTSKYLMVSLFSTQFANLSDTALVLLNNACTYLLGSTAYVPSSDTTLSSITVDGYSLDPVFDPAVTSYSVILPTGTTTIPTTTATTTSAYATYAITAATAVNGAGDSTKIVVTAENGKKLTYYVAFKTVTSIASPSATNFDVLGLTGAVKVSGATGAAISVKSVSGQTIYSGVATSNEVVIPAPQGIVVVLVDGAAKKVLVK